MLRVFDRNNGLPRSAIFYRLERIFEAEARQGQGFGSRFGRRPVRIGAGRSLERNRSGRNSRSCFTQLVDNLERWTGKTSHDRASAIAATQWRQALLRGLHRMMMRSPLRSAEGGINGAPG